MAPMSKQECCRQIGSKIRRARNENMLTLTSLADSSGISSTKIGYLEKGRSLPDVKTINALYQAMPNLDIDSILQFRAYALHSVEFENSPLKTNSLPKVVKPTKPKDRAVYIQLNDEELTQMNEQAAQLGIPCSEYLRKRVLDTGNEPTEVPSRKKIIPQATTSIAPQEVSVPSDTHMVLVFRNKKERANAMTRLREARAETAFADMHFTLERSDDPCVLHVWLNKGANKFANAFSHRNR